MLTPEKRHLLDSNYSNDIGRSDEWHPPNQLEPYIESN